MNTLVNFNLLINEYLKYIFMIGDTSIFKFNIVKLIEYM